MGLGGEEVLAEDLAALWDVLPDLRVYNYYDPLRQRSKWTTYELDRPTIRSGAVPIGVPHRGVRFFLVDADRQLVGEPNTIGELHIAGNQLMRGYWGDEALTDQVLRTDVVPGSSCTRRETWPAGRTRPVHLLGACRRCGQATRGPHLPRRAAGSCAPWKAFRGPSVFAWTSKAASASPRSVQGGRM